MERVATITPPMCKKDAHRRRIHSEQSNQTSFELCDLPLWTGRPLNCSFASRLLSTCTRGTVLYRKCASQAAALISHDFPVWHNPCMKMGARVGSGDCPFGATSGLVDKHRRQPSVSHPSVIRQSSVSHPSVICRSSVGHPSVSGHLQHG